mmetsp:Transcript_128926/g.234225  ORF Transcript_128926/g.234225 Transcript_128926/m.234225 type:complete len:373 (-) Transcript_128926:19-1137(-)
MPGGVLERWFAAKGFGFIKPDDGSLDVFTHIRQLTNGDGMTPPPAGSRVIYEAGVELVKGKPKAQSWTLVSQSGAPLPTPAAPVGAPQFTQPAPVAAPAPQQLVGGFSAGPQFAPAPVPAQPVQQSQFLTASAQFGGSTLPAGTGATAGSLVGPGAVAGASGPTGSLKKWYAEKGFGFIQPDAGGDSFFAHIRQCTNGDMNIAEGVRVTYATEFDARQQKLKASTWSVLSGAGAPAAAGGVDVIQVLQTAATLASNALATVAGPAGTANSVLPQLSIAPLPAPPAPAAPPQPPPVSPNVRTMEMEVAEKYVGDITGPAASGLEDIKRRAGGDIRIDIVSATSGDMQVVRIIGPEVSASLAMCLVLERLSEIC